MTASPYSDTETAASGERPEAGRSESRRDGEVGKTDAFDATIEEIRTRFNSNVCFLFPRLEDQIRRRLRVRPLTPLAGAVAVSTAMCARLGLALVATFVAGDWAEIPWSRWLPVLLFLALGDALTGMQHPAPDVPRSALSKRMMEDATALLPTLERTADVQQLAAYTRRWYRLPVSGAFGVALATSMLLISALASPAAFGDLPAGSVVLLALLFYDLSESIVYAGNLVDVPFFRREARYDHILFWPSPIDSPEVRKMMRLLAIAPLWFGLQVTIFLLLTAALVSWNSPLVVSLAASLGVVGYLVTIFSTLQNRASIGKIVQRARSRELESLQHEITPFRARYTQLTPEEYGRLRSLIDLHNTIRDAPTTPSTTSALTRAAAGLIVPTIVFVVTVFGEVSAERFLDAILP